MSDLADDLRAAFAADSKPTEAAQPEQPSAPVSETSAVETGGSPTVASPAEATTDSDGTSDQPRDEHGRFAPKQPADAAAAPQDTKPAASPEPDKAEAAAEPAEAQPIVRDTSGKPPVAPPKYWADGAKVKWQRLPREVQEELIKVEQRGSYGNLHTVIEPRMQKIAMKGQTPEQAVDTLFATWEAMEQNPAQTLAWLAQQYRVDLAQLGTGAAQGNGTGQPAGQTPVAEPDYVDPQLAALRDEINGLKASLSQFQTQAQTQRVTSVAEQVNQFRSEQAPNGQLAHPHYDIVEDTMAGLLRAGRAKGLKDAYDQAIWLHPELRESMIAEREAAAQRKRDDEARKRSEQARMASGSVTGSPAPGASVSVAPAPTLRAEIERAFSTVRA